MMDKKNITLDDLREILSTYWERVVFGSCGIFIVIFVVISLLEESLVLSETSARGDSNYSRILNMRTWKFWDEPNQGKQDQEIEGFTAKNFKNNKPVVIPNIKKPEKPVIVNNNPEIKAFEVKISKVDRKQISMYCRAEDSDGKIVEIVIDTGDGNTYKLTEMDPMRMHTYQEDGTYIVTATCRDDKDGLATQEEKITIEAFAKENAQNAQEHFLVTYNRMTGNSAMMEIIVDGKKERKLLKVGEFFQGNNKIKSINNRQVVITTAGGEEVILLRGKQQVVQGKKVQ